MKPKQTHVKNNCIVSHAQNTTALQPTVCFKRNKPVTGHKQGTAISSQRKTPPSSTARLSVIMCNFAAVVA
jgi:hypothetical protein